MRLHDGELTVRDHGPGIAAEDVPHVFERFYRATSARSMPGSGLGLAIVRQVAESHNGTITAEPAPGRRHADAAPPGELRLRLGRSRLAGSGTGRRSRRLSLSAFLAQI